MKPVVTRHDATLDSGYVSLGNAAVRERMLRVTGYATPFWVRTASGLVVRADSVPWQGMVAAGQAEVLSADPNASEPLFRSDWSTATGTTDDALLDTDKGYPWDEYKGSTPRGSTVVVTSASLSLTSPGFTNCLLIKSDNNAAEGVRLTDLPNLTVGQTRNYRAYMAVVFPDDVAAGGDRTFHPFDIRQPTGTSWFTAGSHHLAIGSVDCDAGFEGQWWLGFHPGDSVSAGEEIVLGASASAAAHPGNFGRYGNTGLAKRVWWGVEVQYEAVSSTLVRVNHAWVYDADGATVYDDDDFYRNVTGGASLQAGGPEDWTVPALNFTDLQCGTNGFPTGWAAPYDVNVWAAVAIDDDVNQIGAYSSVRGW